jgi:hypothetical protein
MVSGDPFSEQEQPTIALVVLRLRFSRQEVEGLRGALHPEIHELFDEGLRLRRRDRAELRRDVLVLLRAGHEPDPGAVLPEQPLHLEVGDGAALRKARPVDGSDGSPLSARPVSMSSPR